MNRYIKAITYGNSATQRFAVVLLSCSLACLLMACNATTKNRLRGVDLEYIAASNGQTDFGHQARDAICLDRLESDQCTEGKRFLDDGSAMNKLDNCITGFARYRLRSGDCNPDTRNVSQLLTEVSRLPLACQLQFHSIEKINATCDSKEPQDFSVSIIEFNDYGAVNTQQLLQTIRLIETMGGNGNGEMRQKDRAAYERQAPLILMFAHGWHHNADVCDSNLSCFRNVLRTLKTAAGQQPDRPVLGIYLGWRGESHTDLNFPTLYDRTRIARRIGRTGGLEALLEIDRVVREKGHRMITVGHSLGAALIFTAVRKKFNDIERVIDRADKQQLRCMGRRVFGDLVVLVNPAIEATQYEQFHRYNQRRIGRPEMITIASKSDRAMGVPFIASRVVELLWNPSNLVDGGSNFVGMGRYNKHITHDLEWRSETDRPVTQFPIDRQCTCNYSYGNTLADIAGSLVLKPRNDHADSEFIVIDADKDIIGDHNDIYGPEFVSFLAGVVNNDAFGLINDDATSNETSCPASAF